jgi:hypothetical protein
MPLKGSRKSGMILAAREIDERAEESERGPDESGEDGSKGKGAPL